MNDPGKYPWLRVFIFISLCPSLFGLFVVFQILPFFNYSNQTASSLLIMMPIVIFTMLIMALLFSSAMYSPPMVFLAIVVIVFKLKRTPAHLVVISALGGAAALGWCRLMMSLDAGNSGIYRSILPSAHFPIMTDGIVFLLGAVCSIVAAWLALPKRI